MPLSAFEDHFGKNSCLKSLGDWRSRQQQCKVVPKCKIVECISVCYLPIEACLEGTLLLLFHHQASDEHLDLGFVVQVDAM